MTIEQRIKQQLDENAVVLYMKGTPTFPQCGFSGRAVHILKQCNANFTAVNVLEDNEIREGIKHYSNWPTIPQLYIRGELVGGCDIMTELYEQGQLQELLKEAHA